MLVYLKAFYFIFVLLGRYFLIIILAGVTPSTTQEKLLALLSNINPVRLRVPSIWNGRRFSAGLPLAKKTPYLLCFHSHPIIVRFLPNPSLMYRL